MDQRGDSPARDGDDTSDSENSSQDSDYMEEDADSNATGALGAIRALDGAGVYTNGINTNGFQCPLISGGATEDPPFPQVARRNSALPSGVVSMNRDHTGLTTLSGKDSATFTTNNGPNRAIADFCAMSTGSISINPRVFSAPTIGSIPAFQAQGTRGLMITRYASAGRTGGSDDLYNSTNGTAIGFNLHEYRRQYDKNNVLYGSIKPDRSTTEDKLGPWNTVGVGFGLVQFLRAATGASESLLYGWAGMVSAEEQALLSALLIAS